MMTKKRYIALKLVEAGDIRIDFAGLIFSERGEAAMIPQRPYRWLYRKGYIRKGNFDAVRLGRKGRDYLIGQYFA